MIITLPTVRCECAIETAHRRSGCRTRDETKSRARILAWLCRASAARNESRSQRSKPTKERVRIADAPVNPMPRFFSEVAVTFLPKGRSHLR